MWLDLVYAKSPKCKNQADNFELGYRTVLCVFLLFTIVRVCASQRRKKKQSKKCYTFFLREPTSLQRVYGGHLFPRPWAHHHRSTARVFREPHLFFTSRFSQFCLVPNLRFVLLFCFVFNHVVSLQIISYLPLVYFGLIQLSLFLHPNSRVTRNDNILTTRDSLTQAHSLFFFSLLLLDEM